MGESISALEIAVDLFISVALISALFFIFSVGKSLLLKNTSKTTEIVSNLQGNEYQDFDNKDVVGYELLEFYREMKDKKLDLDTVFQFEVHTGAIIDAYQSLNTTSDSVEKALIRERFSKYPAGTPKYATDGFATEISVNPKDANYVSDDLTYHTTLIRVNDIVVGMKIEQEVY